MRIHYFTCCLCAIFICVFGVEFVQAQEVIDVNSLTARLLEKDFKTLDRHPGDSAKVNETIKDLKSYAEARNDSALICADQAVYLAEKAGLVEQISIILQEKGNYLIKKENYAGAIWCFINAIKIEEKLNNEKRIADLNDELGAIYYYEEIFDKALAYNENARSIYLKSGDTLGLAKSLSHIGTLHLSHEYCERRTERQILKDCLIAINYFNQSLELYRQQGNSEGIANANMNMGSAYNRMNKPEIAIGYVEKALEYYRDNKNPDQIVGTLYSLSKIYNRMLNFDQALQCLKEANEVSSREKITDGIQYLYEAMAQTYENLKDYKNSRDYYVKYMTIRDSVYNNEKSQQIFELETKYQTEKKENEIAGLTLIKYRRTRLIYILVASLILVSIFSRLIFNNVKNKKIIAEQELILKEKQLLELEKDRQLNAAKSVLKGEEAERSRLAGDLHDGLGGLLTGVKLKLSSMKENSIVTTENLAHFDHALGLLDTSISELRRVAHNLMPETLMYYGLQTAFADFIRQLTPDGFPLIKFSTFGDDLRYDKEFEITLYRIAQELVNNALKHANASQIDLQLFTENNRICVQIIDDGIGFDPEKLDTAKKGNGLKNIRDRVSAFNGRYEIHSQPGKGTESTIEFLLT